MAEYGRVLRTAAQVRAVWLPLGLVLMAYAAASLVNTPLRDDIRQGTPNLLGFGLHIDEPVSADKWMFGQLPTTWLQDRLYSPSSPHWYDAVAAVVYISHFLVIPAVAMVLWSTNRRRFRSWIWCVSLLVAVGTTTYIIYPMAPPWTAGELGLVDPMTRISGIGWDFLHLDAIGNLLSQAQLASNPVAAMPSMHAASAALVAAFFWGAAALWKRVLLALYPVAMGVTLVYTGEHYVVDVIAGCLAAGAVVTGWQLVANRKRARRPRVPAPPAGGC